MAFQLGAALLDACVLAVLKKGDTYGYVLTQDIKSVMPVSESSLYPVLRRLQKDECLTVYDVPYCGRLRRYYAITPNGVETLERHCGDWAEYKSNVDKLLQK